MKNNTIEVRLNSYGTLEVVTIPVKLYRDSYNVVKLRVNAPYKENSELKVYLADNDEAGDQVWSSKAYSLPFKEYTNINGATYNVYEDYVPQEFCANNGDIRITFAQIVDNDGVEQLITSGSLNLFVAGDGFNYNGVEISDYDNLAIQLNSVLQYSKDYDLKIKTQEEFEAFYRSLDDGTCTASSVLFVGNGGDLTFTRSDGLGLLLPSTIIRVDGINRAKIKVFNFNGTGTSSAIGYAHIPVATFPYTMSNLAVSCIASPGCTGIAIRNVINLTNCIARGYSSGRSGNGNVLAGAGIGIEGCKNVINCECHGYGGTGNTETRGQAWGVYNCEDIVNTISSIEFADQSTNSNAFYECKNIVNCQATNGKVGFNSCTNVVNGVADQCEIGFEYGERISNCKTTQCSSIGFSNVNNLCNCHVDGSEKAYSACYNLASCTGSSVSELYYNSYYISATKEDIEETKFYVDSQIGDFSALLQDINSGEGV